MKTEAGVTPVGSGWTETETDSQSAITLMMPVGL